MKIRPLGNKILVQRLEAESKTPGGLYIPDNAKEKPTQAKVIAVGPGRTLENGQLVSMSVKTGDTVLFGKYTGTEFEQNGEKLLMLSEDDILGVMV